MIYFDNAATGGFKPSAVKDSAINAIRFLNANPGRSGHRLSVTGAEIVFRTRREVAKFFGADEDHVIFTKNCTEALNIAILGTLKKGDHAITTAFEHNSVLRPLFHLEKQGVITLTIVDDKDCALEDAILNSVKENTRLVAVSHVSNVTGKIQDVKTIGKICKEKGIIFLSDSAQSAGHLPINLNSDNVDIITFAGHKGMCAIMGIGGLVFNNNVEIEPIIYGGTGTESYSTFQPRYYPEKLESGTLNLPAISSLYEGTVYIKNYRELFAKTLYSLTEKCIDSLNKIDGVKVYSTPNYSGIVAFLVKGKTSDEVADTLSLEYDIAVRGGLHCAPLMHKYLGTFDTGLVRVSFAPQNTQRELSAFLSAVNNIANYVYKKR